MTDFVEKGAGSILLYIVSRGHALIAELLRLSQHVPAEFNPSPESRYAPLFFDFRYLKEPEVYEERIETNLELLSLSDEFQEAFSELLKRFFMLFDAIVKFHEDLLLFLGEVQEGAYIESSLESILDNEEGRQLLVEALSLHGIILLLLEDRLKGDLRERIVVAHVRCQGTLEISNLETVCTLCRAFPSRSSTVSAFAQIFQSSISPLPKNMLVTNRSEEYFTRFPFPKPIINTVLSRLRSDDLFNQIRHYPNPEHRLTALSAQAGYIYVLLYYVPEILNSDNNAMRDIVDKFFRENWVISVYMGFTVDLSDAWDKYKSAKLALSSTISPAAVRDMAQKHNSRVVSLLPQLDNLLAEGILTQEYVLNKIQILVSCVRDCNVTLRWLLLHRLTINKKIRDSLVAVGESQSVAEESLLTLLLNTSRLEYELKQVYGNILEAKETRWQNYKMQAAEFMQELSDFFSGSQALSKKMKDENLQSWFSQMASQVSSLKYKEAVKAGRRVQHMIAALREVEQFHQIEGSLQTKHHLSEIRVRLHDMLHVLNVHESTLATISVVSDAAYAWGLMGAYTERIHVRIQEDPSTVLTLQCLFLKLRSIMDIPLMRISQCGSGDLYSVSEYYLSELVKYVRSVLEIIPISIFSNLSDVVAKQTQHLHDLPWHLEKEKIRDYAQFEDRHKLAKVARQVAVLSQGIMLMKKTFLGVIELDPRQLLEDGIRKQVMKELATKMHHIFVFSTGHADEFEERLLSAEKIIQSLRQSLEYFQDYVHVHGFRLCHEEFARLINFCVEQECNQHIKRKVQLSQSFYQSQTIPIPDLSTQTKSPSSLGTFMGRIFRQLLLLTDPSRSMYISPMSGWFDANGQEVVGLWTFARMQESLGVVGMNGFDRMLSFDIADSLQNCVSVLRSQLDANLTKNLEILEYFLGSTSSIPDGGISVYKEFEVSSMAWEPWIQVIAHVGQLQLIRCLVASHLHADAKVESNLVSHALNGLSSAVISELRLTDNSTKLNADMVEEIKSSGLISDLSRSLQISGIHSPLETVYITAVPPENFSLLVFMITVAQLPRFILDNHLGTLTSRLKKAALDFCPLVVGLVTLFQQFHPQYRELYAKYFTQYIRAMVEISTTPLNMAENAKKIQDSRLEVSKAAIWILAFLRYLRMPVDLVDACWLLDAMPN